MGMSSSRRIVSFFKRASNATAQAWTVALLALCYYTIFVAYNGVARLLKKELLVPAQGQETYWRRTTIKLVRKEDFARQF